MNDYQIGSTIGKGSFGIVYKVTHIPTSKTYASKEIFCKKSSNDKAKQSFGREIKSYSIIDNPAILKLIGYNDYNFQRKPNPTMILEYMVNGSVEKFLNKKNISNLKSKYFILLGSALGMKYLHSRGIIHRDIKTDNILLNEILHPKICDFGCSEISDKDLTEIQMNESVGTPLYMAPEIFDGEHYSYKVDVYAFSIVAYRLITNEVPFSEFTTKYKLFKAVLNGQRPKIDMIENEKIRSFLNKCWSSEPSKRPEFREIVEELMQNYFLEYFKVDLESLYEYLKENKQIAAKYFKKAADLGNVPSMLKFGFMLWKGYGVKENKKEARKYFDIAISRVNNGDKFEYFVMLPNNSGILIQKIEIIKFLINILNTNNIDEVIDGNVSSPIYGKLCCQESNIKYFKDNLDNCDTKEMFFFGLLLIKQNMNQEKHDFGEKLIQKAADRGYIYAMIKYGDMCRSKGNKEECIKCIKMLADLPISIESTKKGFSLYEELEKENKLSINQYNFNMNEMNANENILAKSEFYIIYNI